MKHLIFAGMLVALTASLAASAGEAEKLTTEQQARAALAAGKPEEALRLVDPIVDTALADAAKDPKAICPSVAAAVLLAFMRPEGNKLTISVEPDWCDAMLVKGYALGELKRFPEEVATLAVLVGHDPENPNYVAEYAFALRSSGDADKGLAAYQRVKRIADHLHDKESKRHWTAVALRGIGYVYYDRQDWDASEKAYRDSLKAEPANPVALHELESIAQQRRNQTRQP